MTNVFGKSLLSRNSHLGWIYHFSFLKKHVEINITQIVKRFSNSKFAKCWKCGLERKNIQQLFCENCKIIQNPGEKNNYFRLLKCDESFDIDLKSLKNKYTQMQSLLHPDKFSKSTVEEKHISEDFSVLVNKAYAILKSPLKRAVHLLTLKGEELKEDENIEDLEFLTEIMDLNEEVQNATTPEKLNKLNTTNKEKITEIESEISEAFRRNNLSMVKSHIIKLKYYNNLSSHISELILKKACHEQ